MSAIAHTKNGQLLSHNSYDPNLGVRPDMYASRMSPIKEAKQEKERR